jgi:hypothetical protein
MQSNLSTHLPNSSQGLRVDEILFLLLLFAAPLWAQTVPPADPPAASNGSGAFATGHYRNLFSEAGHSPAEISHKIEVAFHQLFSRRPADRGRRVCRRQECQWPPVLPH